MANIWIYLNINYVRIWKRISIQGPKYSNIGAHPWQRPREQLWHQTLLDKCANTFWTSAQRPNGQLWYQTCGQLQWQTLVDQYRARSLKEKCAKTLWTTTHQTLVNQYCVESLVKKCMKTRWTTTTPNLCEPVLRPVPHGQVRKDPVNNHHIRTLWTSNWHSPSWISAHGPFGHLRHRTLFDMRANTFWTSTQRPHG